MNTTHQTIRPIFNAAEVAMLATAIESHISYAATANAESAFNIESYKILKRKLDVHLAKLGINIPEYTSIREAGEDSTKWTPSQCYMKYAEALRLTANNENFALVSLPAHVAAAALEYKLESGQSLTAIENTMYATLMGL